MTRDPARQSDPSAPQRLAWELYDVHTRAGFLAGAGALLETLLPADTVSWNAVDLAAGTAEVFASGGTPAFADDTVQALADVAAEHPMVTSYLAPSGRGSVAPRRLSDVISRADLQRSRAYAELLHPAGAEYQLTIVTARQIKLGGRCWTLNRRHRDFDDAERDLATALQPVLIALDIACDVVGGPSEEAASTDGRVLLTARETEVLGCVARGLTAAATARLLRISERTVRKHLEHCYAKLGCNDRLVAVDRARRLGVLGDEPTYVG